MKALKRKPKEKLKICQKIPGTLLQSFKRDQNQITRTIVK